MYAYRCTASNSSSAAWMEKTTLHRVSYVPHLHFSSHFSRPVLALARASKATILRSRLFSFAFEMQYVSKVRWACAEGSSPSPPPVWLRLRARAHTYACRLHRWHVLDSSRSMGMPLHVRSARIPLSQLHFARPRKRARSSTLASYCTSVDLPRSPACRLSCVVEFAPRVCLLRCVRIKNYSSRLISRALVNAISKVSLKSMQPRKLRKWIFNNTIRKISFPFAKISNVFVQNATLYTC